MLNEVLHTVGQVLQTPVIVILLFLLAVTIWQAADLLIELIVVRRKLKESSLNILKKLTYAKTMDEALEVVDKSALLKRQKKFVKELVSVKYMPEHTLTAYAQGLLGKESAYYARSLAPTEMVTKLGPMFGLLGTLIPLGPGIIALGEGDTATLAASIGVAFDTTIAGLIAAAVCFVLSHIRRRWYAKYMRQYEAIAECLVEKMAGTPC